MSSTADDQPLRDLRVVEISQLIAAPLCGLTLSDLGADVVKVESPSGDFTRGWARPGEESAIFRMLNRGKRSVAVDQRTAEGRALVARLIAGADVVLENLGDAMGTQYEIDHEAARHENPRLIWCSISGLGRGVRGRAVDMTLQAAMGMTALTGEADGPPLRGAMPFVDLMTGAYAVQAILVALLNRQTTGLGAFIDYAMVDAAATLTAAPAALSMSGFSTPRRMGSENDLFVPARIFDTRDAEHIYVVAIGEPHWRAICLAAGRDDWLADERFASNGQRLEHRAEIHSALAAVFRRNTAQHWTDAITVAGGFCERVREIEEAWADPLLSERGLLLQAVGLPPTPRASLVGTPRAGSGPRLGEHNDELGRQ